MKLPLLEVGRLMLQAMAVQSNEYSLPNTDGDVIMNRVLDVVVRLAKRRRCSQRQRKKSDL